MYAGKGGGRSMQKPTSNVLVTSLFCLKCLQGKKGGGGVKYLTYLSVRALWMAPYSDTLKFFKD